MYDLDNQKALQRASLTTHNISAKIAHIKPPEEGYLRQTPTNPRLFAAHRKFFALRNIFYFVINSYFSGLSTWFSGVPKNPLDPDDYLIKAK